MRVSGGQQPRCVAASWRVVLVGALNFPLPDPLIRCLVPVGLERLVLIALARRSGQGNAACVLWNHLTTDI